MTVNALEAEIARFDSALPVEEAWTPPASWYMGSEFLERELATVFKDNWICVGRADQVNAPGSYFTCNLVHENYVVLRDEKGVLRAFHNVCRHHAARVMDGEGQCEELACPYHGWTYHLNGALKSAPRTAGIRDFDRNGFGLLPIPVETWGHFVFLYRGDNPRSFEEDFGPLRRLMEANGQDRLHFKARREYKLRCNWKVFIDNYLDGGYHVPVVHHALTGQLDVRTYDVQIHPRYSIQSCAGEVGGEQGSIDFAERIGSGVLYAWLHPTLMLNRYGPMLDTNLVVPLSAEETLTVFDYFFDESVIDDDEFTERCMAASHHVQEEDIRVCESVHSNLRSPAYERGRYAPQVEMGEHHFHTLLAEELRAGKS